MKSRKLILLIVLVLLALLGYWGYQQYQAYEARFVYLNEVRYEKTVEELDLSGKLLGDPEALKVFTNLKKLDLRGNCMTLEEYKTVRGLFPDAQILWDIPFQGEYYPMDTQQLTVTTLGEEELDTLGYFEQLKSVDGTNCPNYPVLHRLRQEYPELEVTYTVPLLGMDYSYDTEELVLPGQEAAALQGVLPYFTDLKKLELTAPLAPKEEILPLMELKPDVQFCWDLELGGISVDESTETLDLTGIPMTVEEMDAVLPYLLNLTYVDMTDCGISNEDMDALDMRYENIKIVWTVEIGWRKYKTDITTFMPARDGMTVYNSSLYNLRYCHDVYALDIGHMEVWDISFVSYMPHLKYLLLGDTRVYDLSPLEGLTELVYLELFMTNVSSCDALLTLTALEDLNVSYTYCDAEVLSKMTWLKNLWWAKPTTLAWSILPEALKETHLEFNNKSSTGNGWRELPNYFAQRDAFGLGYMTG